MVLLSKPPQRFKMLPFHADEDPEHGFDGKIDLLRVAEEREYKQSIYLDNAFLDDLETNETVRNGWRELTFEDRKASMLLQKNGDYYDLDDDVTDSLRLRYKAGNRWIAVPRDSQWVGFASVPTSWHKIHG